MTPLTRPLSRRMSLPAAPSIILTQQLSNICSLALTDEKGPVKMGRERTTRYVALLIMRSWCSVEQSVVCRSCSQALLHVVCTLGNADGSHEWEMWALIKVSALSVTQLSRLLCWRCFCSLPYFEVWGGLFFVSQPLCVRDVSEKWLQSTNTEEHRTLTLVLRRFLPAEPTQSRRTSLNQTRTYNIKYHIKEKKTLAWDSSAGAPASPDLCRTTLTDRWGLI